MATTCSSSSFPKPPWKRDVFLSFGEDTRKNFVLNLFQALKRKGIDAFMNMDEDVQEKLNIVLYQQQVSKVIEESRFSIVVFSENYACSESCLMELAKIAECNKKMVPPQTVVPVFYGVEPSHVRDLQGKFGDAFNKINQQSQSTSTWRQALTHIGKLSGWDFKHRHHSEVMIKEIVENILKVLNLKFLGLNKYFVGMASRVGKLVAYLERESNEVRTIGISGKGGIGKTTIAKEVFRRICDQFEASAFIPNIREEYEKLGGLLHLQRHLFSEILFGSKANVRCDEYMEMEVILIRRRLRTKKVLIVLDDVDKLDHIEALAGKVEEQYDWFGQGSRIIVTTRSDCLLKSYGENNTYVVEKLTNDEALELLCRKAFRQNHPIDDFEDLSKNIVRYSHGNPLALIVAGSFLYGASRDVWLEAMNYLNGGNSKGDVRNALRLGFSGLKDTEKQMFLDIACFFKGDDESHVQKIFESSGFYPSIGISVLIEKALISIQGGKLWMHDLLQEIGWAIVREESFEQGKLSRLWRPDTDLCEVLTKTKDKRKIQGIFLVSPRNIEIKLNADPFVDVKNLRLLKIFNVNFPGCFEYDLSRECLRLLEWHKYPLKSMPSNFQPHNKLVQLSMPNSCIEQLWKETCTLYENLILMDFSNCQNLAKTPDFSKIPNLEKLILEGCKTLAEIHPSIGNLQYLVLLNLKGCKRLAMLPNTINLKSLETFILSGCSNLKEFPNIVGDMKKLSKLFLDGTAIRELPISTKHLVGLTWLNLSDCKDLLSLPSQTICNLKSLQTLNLSGCSHIDQLPDELGNLKHLLELFVDGTSLRKVPSSLLRLKGLKLLSFCGCRSLQLIDSFSGLSSLVSLNLSQCELQDGAIPDDIGGLFSSLKQLDLSENNFTSLPKGISQLSELRELNLSKCQLQSMPKDLPLSLRYICVNDCPLLEKYSINGLKMRSFDSKGFSLLDCRKSSSFDRDYSTLMLTPLRNISQDHVDALCPELIKELITDAKQFEIRFPYHRIPKWCNDWRIGSCVRIKLSSDHNFCRNGTKGFAMFVMVEIKENENSSQDWEREYIACTFRIDEIPIESRVVFQNFKNLEVGSFGISCYLPREWFQGRLSKARSSLAASFSTTRLDVELKMCGIQLMFEEKVQEFSQELVQTANEHLDLVFNFCRHCKHLLDANILESFGDQMTSTHHYGTQQRRQNTTGDLSSAVNQGFITQKMKREIEYLLTELFQGQQARKKMFHFTIPLRSFPKWFFHHSLGDIALCYLPSNLSHDHNWVGLELYLLFTHPQCISTHGHTTILVDLYAHEISTILPITTHQLKIDGPSDQDSCVVFHHLPRDFFTEQINQWKGISVLFRSTTTNVEVEMCGTRLLYKKDSELFIQDIISFANCAGEPVLNSLRQQAEIYFKGVEQFIPTSSPLASSSDTTLREEIESFQKLLTGTEHEAKEVSSLLHTYRSNIVGGQGFKEYFEPVILHSKHYFLDKWESTIQKTCTVITSGEYYSFNHLHIMVETLLFQLSDENWKSNFEFMLEEFFKNCVLVTLTLKGHVISVLKRFDPCSPYNLCFPSKEIPPWFDHQSIGNTVGIGVDSNDQNWRGLVICVRFSVYEYPTSTNTSTSTAFSEVSFKLLCHLESNGYCLNPAAMYSVTKEKFKWLHVRGFIWLTYIPRFLLTELNGKAFLEAKLYNSTPGLLVKKCGIRLFYEEDVDDFKGLVIHYCTSLFDDLDPIFQFIMDENKNQLHVENVETSGIVDEDMTTTLHHEHNGERNLIVDDDNRKATGVVDEDTSAIPFIEEKSVSSQHDLDSHKSLAVVDNFIVSSSANDDVALNLAEHQEGEVTRVPNDVRVECTTSQEAEVLENALSVTPSTEPSTFHPLQQISLEDTTKGSPSLAEFDALITDVQDCLDVTTLEASTSNNSLKFPPSLEVVNYAKKIFKQLLSMKFSSVICQSQKHELEASLSTLLSGNIFPDCEIDEITKFLKTFDYNCYRYEKAHEDLKEVRERETCVDTMKNKWKELLYEFKPVRKEVEDMDLEISSLEKQLVEKREARTRLMTTLENLVDVTAVRQELVKVQQDIKVISQKKNKAESSVKDLEDEWKSIATRCSKYL